VYENIPQMLTSWETNKERFSDPSDNVKSIVPEAHDKILILKLPATSLACATVLNFLRK
jgi:hypothetical protein